MIRKKRVDIVMSSPYLEGMSILIKDGLYESQAEVIKDALRKLFRNYKIGLVSEEPAGMLHVPL
jgi:Arc/MetJ-type ribon-helix-helix transcriptional regulator